MKWLILVEIVGYKRLLLFCTWGWERRVVVVVEIFVQCAVKATVTNAPQSQLIKWVFSSFLNWPTVVSDGCSEAGRLFQSLGPATWKARSPKPVWVRGTTQVETSDEREEVVDCSLEICPSLSPFGQFQLSRVKPK